MLVAVVVVVAAFLASDTFWILSDRHVWPWDQAHYGLETLQLVMAAGEGLGAWTDAMVAAVGFKPPLLVWFGQVFVPLRALTGADESALLVLNIVAECGTYVLVYAISRRMGIRQLESAAGVLALAGASLFIGIGHQYFVETLQGLIVAASVYVALEATRQSFLRTASLTAIVVALGLLVKITMLGFILPMVVYVSIAFIATRGRPRARTKPVDRLLAACALISIAAAAAWYERNGAEVVRDAFGSMVQDSALFYGSRGTLLSKLTYWVSNLSQCFSPFALLGIATVVLVLLACVVALWRLRKLPRRSWISTSVDDGSLMTAAMVGTVLAQILVFSLQINEETRFLMPIFPLFAPIVAWSLSRLKQTAITVVFLLAFALNGVAAHAFAHGYDPLRLATNTWLRQVHPDTGDADTLDKIVALTCGMTSPHGLSVIGVEYPELNQNSAQFYSAKHAPNRSAICQYGSLGYTETEVDRAWQRLFDRDVQQVVTLTAGSFSRQDAFNVTATAIGERLAASEQFALAEHVGERVLIYRRADTATNPAAQ